MRHFLLFGALSVLLLAVSPAQAQFSVTITVDENCHGNFSNTNGFNSALACALQPDPGPGGLGAALTYDILNPPGLVAGDLLLPDADGSGLSDLIRFNPGAPSPNGGVGTLVFYSDNTEGLHDLADTGFPAGLYNNVFTVTEGLGGITDYTPVAGQPGFVAGSAGPVTYVIESNEATPGPASAALILAGFAFLAGGKYLRKRTN